MHIFNGSGKGMVNTLLSCTGETCRVKCKFVFMPSLAKVQGQLNNRPRWFIQPSFCTVEQKENSPSMPLTGSVGYLLAPDFCWWVFQMYHSFGEANCHLVPLYLTEGRRLCVTDAQWNSQDRSTATRLRGKICFFYMDATLYTFFFFYIFFYVCNSKWIYSSTGFAYSPCCRDGCFLSTSIFTCCVYCLVK